MIAVHGGARRVHEPLNRRVRARFEQHLRGLDVVGRVNREVASPALAHAGLGGEMKHMRSIGEQRREIGILNARLDEPEVLLADQPAQIAFLDRTRVIVGEAVDADHVRALGEQLSGERRSDEAGCACDQRLHDSRARTRSGSRHGRPDRSSVACSVLPVARITASEDRTTS